VLTMLGGCSSSSVASKTLDFAVDDVWHHPPPSPKAFRHLSALEILAVGGRARTLQSAKPWSRGEVAMPCLR
ncbi:hypothetical protein M405DRAFT_835964, partial [Rhizopogon salebrosus TDB-379]